MKNDNKGFSLIELIVVIAIMAILVGALAPQLIKYIDKSRVAADQQALGAVYTAVQTAIMDPDVDYSVPSTGASFTVTTTDAGLSGNLKDEVEDTLGRTMQNTLKALKSSKAGTTIVIEISNKGNVTITSGSISVDATGSRTIS